MSLSLQKTQISLDFRN